MSVPTGTLAPVTTTLALKFPPLTPVEELNAFVAPYLTVPRPSYAELPRTELRLRATLLDLQRFRCAACDGDLPQRSARTGRPRTFLLTHPTETVTDRIRARPMALVCGRCKVIVGHGTRHPDGLRLAARVRAEDPFGHLPRWHQRTLTRGPGDNTLRELTERDAPVPVGNPAEHHGVVRAVRTAAEARELNVRVWYVQQDAGFVLGDALVTVEVKPLPTGRAPDAQLKRGCEQALRYVHTQQADAADDPWFALAGVTRIVPVLVVDRIEAVSGSVAGRPDRAGRRAHRRRAAVRCAAGPRRLLAARRRAFPPGATGQLSGGKLLPRDYAVNPDGATVKTRRRASPCP